MQGPSGPRVHACGARLVHNSPPDMPKNRVRDIEMYWETVGDGPPVVFISGLSQDHMGWAFQVPAVSAAGYRCLSFDNRDAGQTSESARAYTIRDMAEDTVALMDAAGVSSAHVVGASMGGMIAQEIAINHPRRVISLTLVCTVPRADPQMAGVLRAWRESRPYCSDVEFVQMVSAWLFTYRFFQNAEAFAGFLQMVAGNPFPQKPAGFQRQCDAIFTHDTAGRLSQITVPTHVIVGLEDILTPARHSREIASTIAGATLTEVADAAHVMMVERADTFNGALLGFLNARKAPSA